MKGLLHYIIGCFITICFTSCIMEDVEPDVEMVNVSISVSLADAVSSRADEYTEAANDDEKMHTLRIVIVRNAQDGEVEHNRFIDLTQPLTFYGTETFEVRANEQKYIYFFVNENHTAFENEHGFSFATDIVNGQPFPYKKLLEAKISLDVNNSNVLDMLKPLPMNSLYSLKVERVDMDKTFWVIRAATKFTYILNNENDQTYELSRLEISNQAAKEHYMHQINNAIPVWSTENNGILQDITSFNTPNEGTTTNHYSFVKDFSNPIIVPAKGQIQLAPIYLAETKCFSNYKSENNYYMTSLFFGKLTSFTGKLENLDYQLPRNTHVVVKVNINQGDVTWEVDVFPYTGVVLEPEFGL